MTKTKPSKGARRTDEELDKKIESTQRLSVLPTTNTRYSMKIFTMKKWLRDRYGPKKVIMEAKDSSRMASRTGTRQRPGRPPGISGAKQETWTWRWTHRRRPE